MEKPLSLTINEFKDKLQTAIMESKLSPTILEIILKDIYMNIREVATQYEQQELDAYYKENNTCNDSCDDK